MSTTPFRFRLPTDRRGWLAVSGAAVLLSVAMLVEDRSFPEAQVPGLLWVAMVGTAAACLLGYPFPLLGLAVAVVLNVANVLVPGMPHGGGTGLITLMFLVGFLAFRLPGRWSLAAWLLAAVAPGLAILSTSGEAFEPFFYLLFLAPAWFVGVLLQRERNQSAQLRALAADLATEREHRTEAALLAERSRIARELHDAVAHSVSVMTLQVGVVRRRLDALPTEQATLRQAEQLGRRSVDELRRIVGLVRPAATDLAPLPSLAQLEDLVEQIRAGGVDVSVERVGRRPELSPAVDMSAYRIVQEALTNALKHAPDAAVRVRLESADEQIVITVSNDGPRLRGEVRPGHGLTGMAERVALFGGTLTHGPGAAGGFTVTAVLPTGTDRVAAPLAEVAG